MSDQAVQTLPKITNASGLSGKGITLHDKTDGTPYQADADKFLRPAWKDLSMYDIFGGSLLARETANCYIIRTGGFYMFPVVYGNGIKGGANNPSAYNAANYTNHLGNAITSPWIEANAGCSPYSAAILWQDDSSFIDSIELAEGGDGKYIRFYVSNIPTLNANATIVVKDSAGNVLWHWHIWGCIDDLTPVTITNANGNDYDILPLNLGWKWDSGKTKGKNPHFQWGRHAPMPCPAAYNSSSQIACYNGSGAAVTMQTTPEPGTQPISFAIKNPLTFITVESGRWDTGGETNLWHNGAHGEVDIIKTIYDPCPIGFTIPNYVVFTGFSATGSNTEDSTKFNVVGTFANGWNFKRNPDDLKGIFFPASGYRIRASGGFDYVGSHGYCWSARAYSAVYAYGLSFGSGYVNPLNGYGRANGCSVRAVRE